MKATGQSLSRRPTARGFALFICGLGLFLLATHLSSNAVFLMAFACLALPLTAPFFAWSSVARVTVRPLPSAPVALGEPAELRFHLYPAPEPSARICLETRQGLAQAEGDGPYWHLLRADLARGVHAVGPVFVAGFDPMGLFRCDRPLQAQEAAGLAPLVIYPRPDLADPARPHRPDPQSQRIGRGDEPAGLRPYRTGDLRRDIDWRATARAAEPIVREYDQSADARACIFDLSDLPGANREAALSKLTAGILAALRDGDATGLRLPGCEIAPGRGAAHRFGLLRALADLPAR